MGAAAGAGAAGSVLLRGSAGAQVILPPIPRSFPGASGSYELHTSGAGYATLDNATLYTMRSAFWTTALAVRFANVPTSQPAVFYATDEIALCVQGKKVGVLVSQPLGVNQEGYTAALHLSGQDAFVTANEMPTVFDTFRGYYPVYLMKRNNGPGVVRWTVMVGSTLSLVADGPLTRTYSRSVYLGGHPERPRLIVGPPNAPDSTDNLGKVDSFFLMLQGFNAVDPTPFTLLSVDDARLSAYDFTTQPPKRVMDVVASTYRNDEDFRCAFSGGAGQERLDGRDSDFATIVARKLAPVVRLHSRDNYRPASVEWFLNRTSLVRGAATMSYASIGYRLTRPDAFALVANGPLTPYDVGRLSSGTEFGSRGETDLISLWPMEAASGTTAVYDKGPGSSGHPSPLSRYQVETLGGEPLVDNRCDAPAYCRISRSGESYLLTYYFFYPYNGDLAPSLVRQWDAPPLADNTGYLAHIGDWERVTARVKISAANQTVELVNVTMEWHGNEEVHSAAPYKYPPRRIADVGPFLVYSAWHSHASHATVGTFATETIAADDVTDNGAVWRTGDHLVFITEQTPWVRYNGLFGANLTLTTAVVSSAPALKNGPEGPAYHDLWLASVTQGAALQ